ncbi:DUF523 domain-containing protein [Marinobacterium arenosum]|uniref:DUF523 domain-containing protein n=1 Tax=Marinobacterium arenosum TaxID=2862496 RepID=UPI001C9793D1|nr:DUF523 domain-containing protein [Marinobacterium arenosum]MBY4676321.1 DUF523 domain-containing protein [Marinobacterium arenosum]
MKKILISACLDGEPVRYDGQHSLLDHPTIKRWRAEGRLLAICPEMAGGLSIPRNPAETQSQFPILITTSDGTDVTPEFLLGAERTLEYALGNDVCCALMKAKSPSCGNDRVYDGSFNKQLRPGSGLAAGELIRAGIPVFNETQLDALFKFVEQQDADLQEAAAG